MFHWTADMGVNFLWFWQHNWTLSVTWTTFVSMLKWKISIDASFEVSFPVLFPFSWQLRLLSRPAQGQLAHIIWHTRSICSSSLAAAHTLTQSVFQNSILSLFSRCLSAAFLPSFFQSILYSFSLPSSNPSLLLSLSPSLCPPWFLWLHLRLVSTI